MEETYHSCNSNRSLRSGDNSIPVLILDGGMGTTLELLNVKIKHSPLWSASAIEGNPEAIVRAHTAFLENGVDIIITNTYQASAEQFERAHVDSKLVPEICRKAVSLAADARKDVSESSMTKCSSKISLSLGAYGSTLPNAEEYDGMYPPPFGPGGVALSPKSGAPSSSNVFNAAASPTADKLEAETLAEDALCNWHLERLRLYADSSDTWAKIDLIAFESIPLLREARAIRRAITQLFAGSEGHPSVTGRPWWISFTFPGGELPQKQYAGGPALNIHTLVQGVFSASNENVLAPSAIGVNCTSPAAVPGLVAAMSRALTELQGVPQMVIQQPWLVLYPNAGMEYQPGTRNWSSTPEERTGDQWCRDLLGSVVPNPSVREESGVAWPWGGVVLGGCCRTGPDDILRLVKLVEGR